MAAEIKKEIALEIAYVLFIDIVGYSKLSIKDQHAAVEELNQIVGDRDTKPGFVKLRSTETAPVLGPAPGRSAIRKNRRLARAEELMFGYWLVVLGYSLAVVAESAF